MIRRILQRHAGVDLTTGYSSCIGVDPGPSVGAAVEVMETGQGLLVRRAVAWQGGRVVWPVGDYRTVARVVVSHMDADHAAVEGCFIAGRRAGLVGTIESAGQCVGALEAMDVAVVARPLLSQWAPAMLGASGLTAKQHKQAAMGALYGQPVRGRETVADWRVTIGAGIPVTEHLADAVGIALWTMGYRLTGEVPCSS